MRLEENMYDRCDWEVLAMSSKARNCGVVQVEVPLAQKRGRGTELLNSIGSKAKTLGALYTGGPNRDS